MYNIDAVKEPEETSEEYFTLSMSCLSKHGKSKSDIVKDCLR